MKIWIVTCEWEYGTSVEGVFSDDAVALEVRAFLQECADCGEEPVQEYCYGSYSVKEQELCGSVAEWRKTWHLSYEKMLEQLDPEHPMLKRVRELGQ